MIILEGPNGAGKSVLAKQLSQDLEMPVHKFLDVPQTIELFEIQCELSLDASGGFVIQDRCPLISEWVYAPIVDKRQSFIHKFEAIQKLEEHDAILVFVDANELKPKDPKFTKPLLSEIYKRYLNIFFTLTGIAFPTMYYNYNSTDYHVFAQQLEELKALREMTR